MLELKLLKLQSALDVRIRRSARLSADSSSVNSKSAMLISRTSKSSLSATSFMTLLTTGALWATTP
jgi:hypothetical protein